MRVFPKKFITVVACVAIASAAIAGCMTASASKESQSPHSQPTAAQVKAWDDTVWMNTVALNRWNKAVLFNTVVANNYWDGIRSLAENYVPPLPPPPVVTNRGFHGTPAAPHVSSGANVGGACGGATNGADRYIGRESGGDPNRWNTQGSGAWGCYQIMPRTWASSCSDLGAHGSASPQAQAACASRLPSSAWASSGPVG